MTNDEYVNELHAKSSPKAWQATINLAWAAETMAEEIGLILNDIEAGRIPRNMADRLERIQAAYLNRRKAFVEEVPTASFDKTFVGHPNGDAAGLHIAKAEGRLHKLGDFVQVDKTGHRVSKKVKTTDPSVLM